MYKASLTAALAALAIAGAAQAADKSACKTPPEYWQAIAFPYGFNGPEVQAGTEKSQEGCAQRGLNFITAQLNTGAAITKDAAVHCVNSCYLDDAFYFICDTVVLYRVNMTADGKVMLEHDITAH